MTSRYLLRHVALLTLAASVMPASFAARAETLDEAWVLAQGNDLGLAAAQSDAEAARLNVRAAKGERWPTLMASGTFTQMQDAPAFSFGNTALPFQLPEVFSHDNFVTAGVSVDVPLYTGGRISSQIAAAEAGGTARSADAERARADLRLAVAESYVAVQRAERALAIAQSSVDSLTKYVGDVAAMFTREVVPRNDLLSAQVARANAEQGRLQAANAFELAKAAYNRRIGLPLDREFTLAPIASTVIADVGSAQVAALEQEALQNRHELAALTAQGEALGHASDAERARLAPQVSLTGGYQYLENQALDRDTFAMAGVGVKWALFDGGQVRSRSASLRQTQRATEQRLNDLRSLIALEVRQSWFTLQEARARTEVARGAVEQAEENLRIAGQQYAAGLVNSTRVLEAEALRVQSLGNRENAQLDVSVAQLRLARTIGRL
ncbi:MAG: TolC family protein [Steroidobacteraceae bacterium]